MDIIKVREFFDDNLMDNARSAHQIDILET